MNMNDVYAAQEHYAEMRRTAAREQANAQIMGGMTVATRGANIFASMVERMRQAMRLTLVVNSRMSMQ